MLCVCGVYYDVLCMLTRLYFLQAGYADCSLFDYTRFATLYTDCGGGVRQGRRIQPQRSADKPHQPKPRLGPLVANRLSV